MIDDGYVRMSPAQTTGTFALYWGGRLHCEVCYIEDRGSDYSSTSDRLNERAEKLMVRGFTVSMNFYPRDEA